jgi:hypothetical protein
MRLHLASLAAALAASSALLTGCSGSATPADLAALQGVSIGTLSEQGSVLVSLDYAGNIHTEGDCKSISATATYNGVDATQIDVGRWIPAVSDSPAHCEHPSFFFDSQDVESATIEIADGTKTITVDIPHLLASRPVAFAAPAPTALKDGDTVTFTAQLAPGDVPSRDGGTAEGTTAGCEDASGYLFAGNTTETAAGASYAVRASLMCETAIPAGTPVALDLAVTEYVYPNVATCDGATACDATALFTTKLHSTWNP